MSNSMLKLLEPLHCMSLGESDTEYSQPKLKLLTGDWIKMSADERSANLANVYGLRKPKTQDDKSADFWLHPQSGKYILTHGAITKIAKIEKILVDYQVIEQTGGNLAVLATPFIMVDGHVAYLGQQVFASANDKNTKIPYPWEIVQKRAFDRAVLDMVGAYAFGFASSEEADEFDSRLTGKMFKEASPELRDRMRTLVYGLYGLANLDPHEKIKSLETYHDARGWKEDEVLKDVGDLEAAIERAKAANAGGPDPS